MVISQAGKKDPEILKQHYLSEDEEKKVRKAFRNPDELPKILIVTEKLLTGFDAPILYCMYLDKPMRDHVLLQAIARVNRPYEDDEGRRKPSGSCWTSWASSRSWRRRWPSTPRTWRA